MSSLKKAISESVKSSGITDLRSWNTAIGLNGSFWLAGTSIIDEASASNQSTFPCFSRPSSMAVRAAAESVCHMAE